jgi:transcriptional regulator with PAS, ATPase and Fis domain
MSAASFDEKQPRMPQQGPTTIMKRADGEDRQGQDTQVVETGQQHRQIAQSLRSSTPSLLPLVDRIETAAEHDVIVLLTGETGTGKTYLGRLIHESSTRKDRCFLAVACGALAANLIESAFFGHAAGAFTGADRARIGKFAAAGNGTLLLDEIDALSLDQQAKLLRVIETGEYEPVGSNETQVSAARLIVASNWNLEEAIEQGTFRRDLYYRLNVLSLHLPPLRERLQDIAPLVRGFVARFNQKFARQVTEISPDALAALERFPWPGNIRQLENAIQQAVLVASGPVLEGQYLPQPVWEQASARLAGSRVNSGASLFEARALAEKNRVQRALASCCYNRARAAASLGISRVTLYKKMKKYGLTGVP